MGTNNAINANSTGLVRYNGTGTYDAVTTTNHNILIGAISNGITNVAPSATSGVAIISQGAAADPTFGTVAIAGGGTNATSMSTSTGIVKFDGTSLVTSTTAKIDASNRLLNASQPCFAASVSSGGSNVTGDGTTYTPIFNTTSINQTSSYNTGTGQFTAPVTGNYFFSFSIYCSTATSFSTLGASTAALFNRTAVLVYNTTLMFIAQGQANLGYFTNNAIVPMTANDTMEVLFTGEATAGAKNISLVANNCFFYGYLLPA